MIKFGTTIRVVPHVARWMRATLSGLSVAGVLVMAMVEPAAANNIRVANTALAKQDVVTKTVNVVFDLAWDNSWRDGADHRDAAWVFVKFRRPGSNIWEHAYLTTNSLAHQPAANSTIAAVPDARGVFIYRSADYAGSVNYTQTKLQWNYGSNGCDFAKGAVVDISVHAIEMVYIPAGAFFLGSGGTENGTFTDGAWVSGSSMPYRVTSEDAITITQTVGNLWGTSLSSAATIGGPGILSNSFPKGYAAFYCMKYEVSQGQYADFLSRLTTTQAGNLYPNKADYRHTVSVSGGTNYIASRPDRACNYLSWTRSIAYADWAALRPMTELEFEKVCRGTANPVPNEYVWGSTSIMADASRTLSGAEDGTETVTSSSSTNGGCNYGNKAHTGGDGGTGPLRCGIFATNGATRVAAGAAYYGVLDMGGNLYEWCVAAGNTNNRAFKGAHGDGVLNSSGYADVPDWPGQGIAGGPDTSPAGTGWRGGTFDTGSFEDRISDRYQACRTWLEPLNNSGFRGVRSAP